MSSQEESLVFEAVLDRLVAHGWVAKRSRQRLDSTHVRGVLKERSCLECARETLRPRLENLEATDLLPEEWDPMWQRYVEGKPDPRSGLKALQALSAQAGEDMQAIPSDKAGMAQVLVEQQAMGLDKPSVIYVDGVYVSGEGMMQARREGRELSGPAPASPDRGKVFPVDRYEVQVEDRSALCPAGQRSSNGSRLEEKTTGKVDYRFEWSNPVCGACPLREQCVSAGQAHRTIVVGQWHSFLQARRQQMKTEAFEQEMHRRNGIEGTQSELVRGYGLRQARYRGKAKNRLQNCLIGAACTIRRLFRRIAWQRIQGSGVEKSNELAWAS